MIEVAVIRRSGVPVASMERFADAMLASRADPQIKLVDGADLGDAPQSVGERHRWSGQWQRWVIRPNHLRDLSANAYHLVDHSEGHLLRALPAQRTVVTCHDLLLLRAASGQLPWSGQSWWIKRFRWSVSHLRLAAAVACPSEATRRDVLRYCAVRPERAVVIPQGVADHFRPSTPEQRHQARTALHLNDRKIVLQVASGGFYKNASMAIRVLAALAARRDVTLVRVGTPMSAEERRLAVDLRVIDRIVEVGRVSDERLVELYGAADVLLFPSTAEGFGWPVLEAMACGLPVVSSDAPALVEVGGDATRRADPHDLRSLAGHVRAIFEDPAKTAELRTLGTARAASFGWERAHRAYAELYRRVAEASSAGVVA